MTALFKQLNLRPQERRFVVLTAAIIFVVLNVWLVWPHFDDWRQIQRDREKAERTLDSYRKEINRIPVYEAKMKELENAGYNVIPGEQDLNLALTIENQSRAAGPGFTIIRKNNPQKSSLTKTNMFFEEQAVNLDISTGNEELINFLVSLATTNSLIRVQNLTLRPESGNSRLQGQMTLVASYQKNPPVAATAPASRTNPPPKPTAATESPKPLAASQNPAPTKP